MWKKLPLCAAVLALCACSSAPKVQFPSGSGQRTPINGAVRAPDSPYLNAERPPAPMEAKRFYVEAGATSVMAVVGQWARRSNLLLNWNSSTDYPVTGRIRDIRESTLDAALEKTHAALAGVEKPLVFGVKDGYLVVRDAGDKAVAPTAPSISPSEAPLSTPPAPTQKVSRNVEVRSDALFSFGSTQLSTDGKKAVAGVAEQLRAVSASGYVVVVGHADRIGADQANVMVSFQRASIVRAELKRHLPQAQIFAEGRGSKEPVVDCPGAKSSSVIECLAPNRRVTVQGVSAAVSA